MDWPYGSPQLRRFWIEQESLEAGQTVEVFGEEFRHICVVCRMAEGSHFEVLNPGGNAYFSVLKAVGKKSATLELLEKREIPQQKPPWLRLIVSLPKFSTFDLILEKSVELGVKSVEPVFSEFSFVRSKDKVSEAKIKRWSKIVVGATRQCARGDLMSIGEPRTLSQALEAFNQTEGLLGLFPYEGEASQPFSQALAKWRRDSHQEIWCFVGSEGGFSDKEVQLFQSHGIESCTLGEQVLRVETACLALTSVIKYHTGQLL
jgi:16S rRNA (uracil1498-N3)-methyltransferase